MLLRLPKFASIKITTQYYSVYREIPENYRNANRFDPKANFPNPVDQLIQSNKRFIVGGWLGLCAGGVLFMILLGGYTRLTQSGLSMVKWKPIEYSYPRTEEEWIKEFEHYKEFPEYQHNPTQYTIDRFKQIYTVEYVHRVSGSSIGCLYVLPLLAFYQLKWITPKFAKRLSAIGGLGLLQGLIGWWMVKSGLNQPKPTYQTKPRVSTYRLMTHLTMATTIYSLLVWNCLTVIKKPHQPIPEHYRSLKRMRFLSVALIHLVAVNILTGATMAGIDAGKVYNTWPLMNGAVVPDGLMKQEPIWRNFFENNTLLAAYTTYSLAGYLAYKAYRWPLPRQTKLASYLVFGLVNYQLWTGIKALWSQAQVSEASVHQFNAMIMLSATLLLLHSTRKPSVGYKLYLKQFL